MSDIKDFILETNVSLLQATKILKQLTKWRRLVEKTLSSLKMIMINGAHSLFIHGSRFY